MFEVQRVKDSIQLEAYDLGKPTSSVLASKIDERFPNRVLLSGGLVICRHEKEPTAILSSGICKEGKTYWKIEFSLIVFRPFVGEILVGTIAEANASGIRVTLGEFFGAIYVPAYWMLRPSTFENNKVWVWMTEDEKYEMPIGSEIRVRVKSLHYTKRTVTAKGKVEEIQSSGRKRSGSVVDEDIAAESKGSAMHIIASICEDGLGLTEWWRNISDDPGQDGDEEEVVAEGQEETYEGELEEDLY